MKFTTISRRVAATGAATALVTGAVVGLTGTTATAAPQVDNDYGCSTASGLAFPVNLLTEAVGIEGFPQIGAGATVPAGLLTVTNHATMPAAAAQALGTNGVDHVEIIDWAADFGGMPVGATGIVGYVADVVNNGDGTVGLDLPKDDPATPGTQGGLNVAFEVPAAGEYDILMPSGFTINALAADGTLITVINCALADGEVPAALHHITVVKGESTTTAKATRKSFVKGKAAKVAATVTGSHLEGSKVVLKKGTRKLDSALLNENGKAVLSTTKLPVGRNKLRVIFKGNGYSLPSKSDPVIVKVVNP